MDQIKTGKFIAERRKEKGLTQSRLAEMLLISDKTISKWECGNGLPEVSLMLPLCEILEISVNELLCGEKLDTSEYKNKAEELLMDFMKEREVNKKKIILAVIATLATLLPTLTLIMIAGYLEMETWLRGLLIGIGLCSLVLGLVVASFLESSAGYFECKHCKTRFVPTMGAYLNGIHGLTWRRLKCPECGKVSNCRKRLSKK